MLPIPPTPPPPPLPLPLQQLPQPQPSPSQNHSIRPNRVTVRKPAFVSRIWAYYSISIPSRMVQQHGLLGLPAELQLQIAAYLIGGVKDSYRTDDILNMALSCHQLATVVREALCSSLIFQSCKVHMLLRFLFKYPDLAKKIKSLTIETRETRKDKASPEFIPHLESNTLRHCRRHIRALPIQKYTQDNIIALLKADRFEDHGILLCLLLTMLPQLEKLYLGGSILLNFPLFRNMIPNEPSDVRKPDWTMGLDMSWVVTLIGPKLIALELPIDLRRNHEDSFWWPLSIFQIPKYFPNLRWLSLPHMVATEVTETTCLDIIPRGLETLILADARCHCFEKFSEGLVDGDTVLFPRLSKIALYHRYQVAPTDQAITKALADIGIEVLDYIPNCCLRSGDEFYHPWKYTPTELDALAHSRHIGYATEWKRVGWQCDSDED